MKTIRLLGQLGKKFGRSFKLDVKSPAEAVRALCANLPEFERELLTSDSRGVGYHVFSGRHQLEAIGEIHDPASGDIKIVPVIMGASAGTRILAGAALVVAAVLTAPFTAGTSLAFLPTVLGGMGASLVLGGVAQLLSPPPSIDEPPERPENQPSYNFNGPVNTTAQGQPVPILYGRMIVGGAIVSAGIDVTQLKSGYKWITITKTMDAFAASEASTEYHSNATTSPIVQVPREYFRKELLYVYTGNSYPYKFRFYFYERVRVLA